MDSKGDNQNKVIYTAIFGGYDILQTPTFSLPDWDFICFSDRKMDSEIWDVRVVEMPQDGDAVRSARKIKICAHEFLPGYDISVWVDGNIVVRGNINELADKHLSDYNLAVYSHQTTDPGGRDGIYEEAKELIRMTKARKYKGDPDTIRNQVEGYREEGYPQQAGLAVTSVLLRKHNSPKVKKVMKEWWKEVRDKSRRDQLSFNYAAWKHDFNFKVIEENGWDNKYFYRTQHRVRWYEKPALYAKYLWKQLKNIMYA